MVSTKYIQAIVHSSSPEKKKREKNILQSQTVTTVKGIVRETVMAIVNRKIQKQVSVSHKQKSKWQNLYAPPTSKQGTVNCLQLGSCGITVYLTCT